MGLTRYLPGLLRMKKGKSQLQPDAKSHYPKGSYNLFIFWLLGTNCLYMKTYAFRVQLTRHGLLVRNSVY